MNTSNNKCTTAATPDSCFSLNLSFRNIEGIIRNRLAIQYLFDNHVQVLCLSELNGPDSTISLVLQECPSIRYCTSDSSETNFGRAAILWKSDLDPIITQWPYSSPSFACIKIGLDGTPPIFLISVYMPTAGKDPLYIDTLAKLSELISNIYDSTPDSIIILGGDFNNNYKNKPRFTILSHFLAQYRVSQIRPFKPTYHHHIGDGVFDSYIDSVILINPPTHATISLYQHLCPLNNPLFDSTHDVLMVKFCMDIPPKPLPNESKAPSPLWIK